MIPLVECVPNFSEGRESTTLEALRAALVGVPGVCLLDEQADASHHRSVYTFVAPPEAALEAAFRAIRVAAERIDLRRHRGEHPRMGAADVVPFVPLAGVTMDDCVQLARRLGERVGSELGIPVFLYERAATRPERVNLAEVRRGEFEALREAIGRDPDREPDYGPRRIHPSAGAVAIGARPVLVAYNVYLRGPAAALAAARAVAKRVRASSGGLPAVKALGMEVGGESQVSMNLVDIDTTPVHAAFEAVAEEARRLGAEVSRSEIVGLVPERAIHRAAESHLRLAEPVDRHLLEAKVRRAAGPTLTEWLAALASGEPAPGGGSAAALAGAIAAALAAMVARLTLGRKKYAAVADEFAALLPEAERLQAELGRLADQDADAYRRVRAAYALPQEPDPLSRERAIQDALLEASRVPLAAARAAARVAALARRAAEAGNRNARSDAGVAAHLADAAARGAAYNVAINVGALPDREAGRALVEEAERMAGDAAREALAVHDLLRAALDLGA